MTHLLLIAWICLFSLGSLTDLLICAPILITMVISGLKVWIEMGKQKEFTWFTYFSRNVFAFYLGWVIAAANLNIGIVLVYGLKVSYTTQLVVFWISSPLFAIGATLLNVLKEGRRGLLSCLSLWASVAWAFVGAAITSASCLQATGK